MKLKKEDEVFWLKEGKNMKMKEKIPLTSDNPRNDHFCVLWNNLNPEEKNLYQKLLIKGGNFGRQVMHHYLDIEKARHGVVLASKVQEATQLRDKTNNNPMENVEELSMDMVLSQRFTSSSKAEEKIEDGEEEVVRDDVVETPLDVVPTKKAEEKKKMLIKGRKGKMGPVVKEIPQKVARFSWKHLTENLNFLVQLCGRGAIKTQFQNPKNNFQNHMESGNNMIIFYYNPSYPQLNSTIQGICTQNMKLLTVKDGEPKLNTTRKRKRDIYVPSAAVAADLQEDEESKEDSEEEEDTEEDEMENVVSDDEETSSIVEVEQTNKADEENEQLNDLNEVKNIEFMVRYGQLLTCFDDDFENNIYRLLSSSFHGDNQIVAFMELTNLFLNSLPRKHGGEGPNTKNAFKYHKVPFVGTNNTKKELWSMELTWEMITQGVATESLYIPYSKNVFEARRMYMVEETEKNPERAWRNCFRTKMEAGHEFFMRTICSIETIRCSLVKRNWGEKNLQFDQLHPVFLESSVTN